MSASDSALLKQNAQRCELAESALHDDYLSKWGLKHATAALPTTVMYTSYLLRVCATRPHAEGLASLLPSYWVHMHVSNIMLKKREQHPKRQHIAYHMHDEPYKM